MTNSYYIVTAYPRIHSDHSFKVVGYSAVKPKESTKLTKQKSSFFPRCNYQKYCVTVAMYANRVKLFVLNENAANIYIWISASHPAVTWALRHVTLLSGKNKRSK